MPEQKIHLTDIPPSRCSSCFGAYTERVHIDFGATWDGPTFKGEVEGAPLTAIDDLIVCADCIRDAAKLLGFEQSDEAHKTIKDQESEIENLRERLRGALDALQKAADAKTSREVLEGIMARTEQAA